MATGGSAQWRVSPQYPSAVRIGIWGDSHTASGSFVDAMLQAWGFPADGARVGHVQPAIGLPGVRLGIARTCLTKGWNLSFAYRSSVQEAGFTSTLVKLRSDANDEVVVLDFPGADGAPAPQWLNIHLDKPDPDATLIVGISINGGPEAVPQVLEGAVRSLQVIPDTEIRTLRLRLIAGQLGITGFEPVYRSTPKLLFDIFSTPGAQAKGWANPKIKPISAHYDMVIFQYGANEAPSDSYQPAHYAAALRKELRQFRATYPKARCVVVGPPDRVGTTPDKKIDYPARHQSISKVQALVAPEFRCEHWDWQKAMGGPKSVLAWAKRAEPLAQPDWMHLTSQGYVESARLFAAAIQRPALQAK
jgi:lysophospholipase L1-like esterase